MKLVTAIVHGRDKGRLTDALVHAGFKFTVIGSTGGFLREGNSTFLLGVEAEELPHLLEIIGGHCQTREQVVNVGAFEAAQPTGMIPSPVKVPVGGAVVFVQDVESFHRF